MSINDYTKAEGAAPHDILLCLQTNQEAGR